MADKEHAYILISQKTGKALVVFEYNLPGFYVRPDADETHERFNVIDTGKEISPSVQDTINRPYKNLDELKNELTEFNELLQGLNEDNTEQDLGEYFKQKNSKKHNS